MRLSLRRRPVETPPPGILATARVDVRTRQLAQRLRPGDIAVIDHRDLDQGAAEALVAARPAAVVNAASSISGRFPALGARALVDAGVPLVDGVGPQLLTQVSDGAAVRLDGDVLHIDDRASVTGVLQTRERVERAMAAARTGLDVQLEAVTATATELLRREHAVLLDGSGAPVLRTSLRGRPVVVVVEGPTAADDLRTLRAFVRDRCPVLVGVETGADVVCGAACAPTSSSGRSTASATPPCSPAPSWCCTRGTPYAHSAWSGRNGSWSRRHRSRTPDVATTRRCCWLTRTGPRSSCSPVAPTASSQRSTRAGQAWRARSSPGSSSEVGWSPPPR
jgi:uncharacterized membrane-anchored protein